MSASESQPNARILVLAFGALVATWGWLLYITHYHWGSESYYNFGWFVPLLAGYFLYRKVTSPSLVRGPEVKGPKLLQFGLACLVVVVLVALVRLFSEANPFWRIPLWAHGLLLMGLSFIGVFLFGGWAAVRHFFFPVAFLLMALPWPYRLELWVIQTLTQWVTDLTVTVVNLVGYPASSQGNTIQVADSQVGVDEACSGIRSLQTLVMLALFFGEFFYFGLVRRGALLLGAVALALGFNGIRATSLTLVTVRGDEAAFEFWHDFLGNFNAIICSVLLFILAEVLQRMGNRMGPSASRIVWTLHGRWKPGLVLAMLAGGFLFSELTVKGYFAYREQHAPALPPLTLSWPEDPFLEYSFSDLPEETIEILKCEFSGQVEVAWRTGLRATLIHYGYSGDDRMASVSSFGHSPKVCMTSIGARLVAEKPPLQVRLLGHDWPVQHYEFAFSGDLGEQRVQVFWLVWEAQQMGITAEELGALTWRNQWRLVQNGRRNFGRQVILLSFPGNYPDGVLRQKVQELLDKSVS